MVVIPFNFNSLTNLPWNVPLVLSISPFAWDTDVVFKSIPNCLQAYPYWVNTSFSLVLLSGFNYI